MAPRKKAGATPALYPFPFLQHGPWTADDYRESVEWQVVFQTPVVEDARARALETVPRALGQSSWAGDRVLTLSTGQDAGVWIWNACHPGFSRAGHWRLRGEMEGTISSEVKRAALHHV